MIAINNIGGARGLGVSVFPRRVYVSTRLLTPHSLISISTGAQTPQSPGKKGFGGEERRQKQKERRWLSRERLRFPKWRKREGNWKEEIKAASAAERESEGGFSLRGECKKGREGSGGRMEMKLGRAGNPPG